MDAEEGATRVEHDSMGQIEVPASAQWGAQTQRAVENLRISGRPLDMEVIVALARIKGAAAAVNGTLGVIDEEVAQAVGAAAADVVARRWDDQFPIDAFQTGSGTSSHMNVNEVLAHLASARLGRPVHPNDDVNASQSSNDVFPSAVHLAVLERVAADLIPGLRRLADALRAKSAEFAGVVKAGRTHLMDATPVTLGQEFGGYATAVENGVARLEACMPRLGELPLGGTAVGTGINAPAGFASAVIERLAADLGHDLALDLDRDLGHDPGLELGRLLAEARDHFEAQAGRDALVETSGALRTVAVSLARIVNDLRWMASGPTAGLGEIRLPALQPGSSIMPGKVNPVIPEVVAQVAAQVVGNDAAVVHATGSGAFELNVAVPVIARNVLESVRLLAAASRTLADHCVSGIVADEDRCRRYALSSPAIATALAPHLGYETVAELVRTALAEGKTLRAVVLERGLMTAEEVDKVLDVRAMTRGGTVGGDFPH